MAKVKTPINPAVAPGDLNLMQQAIDDDFRFGKLIENSFSGIFLLDKYLNIIYRSSSAERINGWNKEDRQKFAITDLIHPSDREGVKQLLGEVLTNPGVPKTCCFRSKHFNGHFIWLESTYTNMLNEHCVEAVVCNFIDVTEKKQTEESLQQTVNELFAYKHALDESAIVAITDQKGIIKHVNDNFCRISKYSREELIGQDHRIINSSYHDKGFIRNLWTTIAGGKIWKGELKNKAKDGSYYWVDTTIVPFLNEQGKPYQYVAIRSDITERKLNQEKIIEREQFTKTITDNLPALIAYWDADMRCLFANKPYLDWFDKQPHEMQGISKQELLGKEEFKLHENHIQNVLKGQPQRFERTFQKSNGQQIFTDTQYLPDRQGHIIKGFYSLIYDISPVKIAEIAEKKALKEQNTILESIDDAFFAVDKNWVVTYWNKMAEKVFRKSRNQIVNRSLLNEYPYLVNTEAYKYYCQVLDTGRSAHFEYYSSHYNLWLDANVYPGLNGFTVYMRNVTDRKNAESLAMAALEERNTILESIDDAFFAVDKNWVVTYWNQVAERVLLTPKDKILNHDLWEIFSDSVDSESYKKYHEAVETRKAVHFEDYYAALNKWYEISAYPSNTGLSVYFKDITERKTSETRLKELNASLKKHAKELAISNAELEQFAYVASHDLQEPLRMVTGFMTQLENKYGDIVDDKGKQYIHFAVDGAKRMRQIILDLLEFSTVGRTADDLEEVNLNNLVNEILALYRKQIEEKNARILFDNLPVIQTYKTPFRQVLQNLISNSLKYQAHQTAPLITISYTEDNIHWQFSVKDNGIGIDAAYFDKIFIIFQRLHNKEDYSGTGMGLAITKKIVENLGGKIWIESEIGKGSIFHFTILKNHNI